MKVRATTAALLASLVVGSCSPRTAGREPMPPVTPSPAEPPASGSATKTDSPETVTVPSPPASPGPREEPPRKEPPAPSEGKQQAAPALDVASLEKRLRETTAIGFFTKLSLKNQMDDLRERFRAFHEARSGATLAELRQRYELLLLKVLSLLQDSDPRLARDISAAREALWSLLTDPVKFRKL